jgi:phosphate/sulfate permease
VAGAADTAAGVAAAVAADAVVAAADAAAIAAVTEAIAAIAGRQSSLQAAKRLSSRQLLRLPRRNLKR